MTLTAQRIRTCRTPRRGSSRRCSTRSARSRRRALRCDPGAAAPEAPLDLEPALGSEVELRRRLDGAARPQRVEPRPRCRFLGGGCWPHYVPAVCRRDRRPRGVPDRVLRRDLLRPRQVPGASSSSRACSASWSSATSSLSRPTTGAPRPRARSAWPAGSPAAAARSCRRCSAPERRSIITGTCAAQMTIDRGRRATRPPAHSISAASRRAARRRRRLRLPRECRASSAPSSRARRRSRSARTRTARSRVVGVDPVSLGVLERRRATAPTSSAASCRASASTCTTAAGTSGFIATPDDERFVARVPDVPDRRRADPSTDEYGFGEVRWDRMHTSSAARRTDFTGHDADRCGRSRAAVYLAPARPGGHARARHGDHAALAVRGAAARRAARACARRRSRRRSSRSSWSTSTRHRRTVAERQPRRSQQRGIFGALDLSGHFPTSARCALVCVTEVHTKADIDRLADALAGVMEERR